MRFAYIVVACVALLALTACTKENAVEGNAGGGYSDPPGAIGHQCTGSDDPACGVGSVCVLGYCRTGCTTDAECPQGTLCIGEIPPFGCQLPQDLACNDTDKPCQPPLVCSLEKTCRMACAVSADCPRNEHECIAGVCVGDGEKGEAARAYRSCEEGETRCGEDGGDCTSAGCEVQGCSMVEPGWAVVEECPPEASFCQGARCVWANPICSAGELRCVNGEEPDCASGGCLQECNVEAPGWYTVETCAYCRRDGAYIACHECEHSTGDPDCDACMRQECATECAFVTSDPDYANFAMCVEECPDPACLETCDIQFPNIRASLDALRVDCLLTRCASVCQ